MTETLICELHDRRNPMRPIRTVRLFEDRLEWVEDNKLVRRLAFNQIRQVRLSVEMAGQLSQVVCRISGAEGEIVFGSRSVVSPGVWDDNALDFQTLLVAIHSQLEPHEDQIAFLEGQTLQSRLIFSGVGLTMASAAIGYMTWILINGQSTMLAIAGLPFAVIGGYLAYVFRPGRPVPYDRNGLINRFKGSTGSD